jgi:DNA-binding NarL/FixJ family response regulator
VPEGATRAPLPLLRATMRGDSIQVAVAGAHDIVAKGLTTLLGEAPDVSVLDHYPTFGVIPDVVVYDAARLAEDDGVELFALIKDSDSAVLIMGRDLRPDLAARAIAHGATGVFSIESDAEEVLTAIRAAASGDLEAVDANGRIDVLGADVGLTFREVQVLGEITRGLHNAEICDLLGLSLNTIKSYIRSAYRKIDVDSRAKAVAWCLIHGFEPPPS